MLPMRIAAKVITVLPLSLIIILVHAVPSKAQTPCKPVECYQHALEVLRIAQDHLAERQKDITTLQKQVSDLQNALRAQQGQILFGGIYSIVDPQCITNLKVPDSQDDSQNNPWTGGKSCPAGFRGQPIGRFRASEEGCGDFLYVCIKP